MARFLNGLNKPIKKIVDFQPYKSLVELLHQATKAERHVQEDIKYEKTKAYFASRNASTKETSNVKPTFPSSSKSQAKQQDTSNKLPMAQRSIPPNASSQASTGTSKVTCFKCGGKGHKSFECVNNKIMFTDENGNCESMSEDEYEALAQVALTHHMEKQEEEQLLCEHDASPSLVVTKVLTTHPQTHEDQRCNIFQTRAGIDGKSIKVIIDGGSCHNLASTELCNKLKLPIKKHAHPYHVQWLSDNGNVKIQYTVSVSFKIGPYEDTVECDVVPMTVCHMLLGRPWQFDKGALHDGRTNVYSFKCNDKTFVLHPMTPSQIIADNAKALARAQEEKATSEMSGEFLPLKV
jgi:hypothetical protein